MRVFDTQTTGAKGVCGPFGEEKMSGLVVKRIEMVSEGNRRKGKARAASEHKRILDKGQCSHNEPKT